MEDEIQPLKYDHENESFQWHGTSQELQSFVNLTLNLADEEHGELCQDRAHNAVTYKIKDLLYIRFYNTTRKLVINGPENRSFKTKLLDLLKSKEKGTELHNADSTEPSNHGKQAGNVEDEGCAVADQADHDMEGKPENQTDSSLKSELQRLRKDFEKLEDFVYNGGHMQNTSSSPSRSEDKDMQIKSLREENCTLQAKVENLLRNLDREERSLREASSKIRELDEERSSLLTALRLLQLDYNNNQSPISASTKARQQAKSSKDQDDETPSNPPWSTVTRQPKQSKNKNKTKQPTKEHQTTRTNATPTIIMGDSIVKRLRNDRLSRSTRSKVQVCSFSGAHIEDMYHYAAPTLKKVGKPAHVILHIGTNDMIDKTPTVVADKIVDLAHHIEGEYPQTKISISELTTRTDDEDLTKGIKEVNKLVSRYCSQSGWSIIKHKNIDDTCLNKGKLHLNSKGVAILASNFTQAISNFH